MNKLYKTIALALSAIFACPLAACQNDETIPYIEDQTESETAQSQTITANPANPSDSSDTVTSDAADSSDSTNPTDNETDETTETENEEVALQTQSKEGTARYILVLVDDLNVRAGAGTNYSAVAQAEKGTLYAYLGETGNWYKSYYRGETAYLSADSSYTALVSMEKSGDEIERVIGEGLKLLGVPYVYGATRLHNGSGVFLSGFTAREFDCSSLMQYIFYYGANVLLATTTRTQVLQGTAVEKENIARGDLLFFTNATRYNNTGIERVGHVALYLGNNYILHTSSDYAKIEQISDARWNYFLAARRVIG